jgi:uncharacterized membrane protein YhaH (DUF805 family)
MTEFVNMWKNYVNFSARTTRRGYWMAYLFYAIIYVILYVTFVFILPDLIIIFGIFALASFLPFLAITIRRLRDAGKHWACIFLQLIPIVGGIILIVFLAKASVEDTGVPVV